MFLKCTDQHTDADGRKKDSGEHMRPENAVPGNVSAQNPLSYTVPGAGSRQGQRTPDNRNECHFPVQFHHQGPALYNHAVYSQRQA